MSRKTSWKGRVLVRLQERFPLDAFNVGVFRDYVVIARLRRDVGGLRVNELSPIKVHYSGLKAQTMAELIREIETEIAIQRVTG